jgi:hypothetical protein
MNQPSKISALKIEERKPQAEPTKQLVAEITADAKREAERYLRETIVPEGGECAWGRRPRGLVSRARAGGAARGWASPTSASPRSADACSG